MKKRQKERKPARRSASDLLAGYEEFLSDLKTSIRSAQIKAALSVNSEMIALYWEIGKGIVERQEKAGWGDDILMRLSSELKHEFPEIQGFSRTNLYRMRALYLAYRSQSENVPQAVGQIPWGHNLVIVEKLKDPAEREWYMQNTIEYGWSRAVLLHQIETRLYQRQAKSREGHQLCAHAAAAAIQHLASGLPYFLTLGKEARARDLERALVENIRDFLLRWARALLSWAASTILK